MTAVTVGDPVIHHEEPDTVGRRQRTGVALLILADVAFLASLLFAYFYLRGLNTEKGWVLAGDKTAAIWVGWLIALGMVVSAALYRWGDSGLRAGHEKRLPTAIALAVLVLVIDLAAQVVQLVTFPFGVADSAYASSIYTLAGANLFHLVLTLFIGLGMWNRTRLGKYAPDNSWQVRIVGIWWTWIAVAALATALVTSFIASPNHLGG
jgi:heme/copper-type cytochrome/quinol oxidase subunit 3